VEELAVSGLRNNFFCVFYCNYIFCFVPKGIFKFEAQ
jgi:hypothetical protein